MNRGQLVADLWDERHNGTWWTAARRREEAQLMDDSDINQGRRRRAMAEDFDQTKESDAS